jgi:hypothetical protein
MWNGSLTRIAVRGDGADGAATSPCASSQPGARAAGDRTGGGVGAGGGGALELGQQHRGGAQRLGRRAPLALHQDGAVRHAVRDGVAATRGGLAGAVAGAPAAGDDEARRQAAVPQGDRVVEAGAQHRRRAAVVLRRAHHDDGGGGARAVAVGGRHHRDQRAEPGEDASEQHGEREARQDAAAGGRRGTHATLTRPG